MEQAPQPEPEAPQTGTAPEFIIKPESSRAPAGVFVTLSCTLSGDPAPELIWFFNGQEITTSGKYTVRHDSEVHYLEINGFSADEAGEYECVGYNSIGECRCTLTLEVEGAPVEDVPKGSGPEFIKVYESMVS